MITIDWQRVEQLLDKNKIRRKDPRNWEGLARATESSRNRMSIARRAPSTVNFTLKFVDRLSLALDCTSKYLLTEDPNKQKGKR